MIKDPCLLTELAKAVATKAHEGQTRKFEEKGLPYIIHPERVAEKVNISLKPVAWLHDVLEDTQVTEEELRKDFPKEIVDSVVVLTRKKDETYFDYIMRVLNNPQTIPVKVADIQDNLQTFQEGSLKDKHRLAQYILINKFNKYMETNGTAKNKKKN